MTGRAGAFEAIAIAAMVAPNLLHLKPAYLFKPASVALGLLVSYFPPGVMGS